MPQNLPRSIISIYKYFIKFSVAKDSEISTFENFNKFNSENPENMAENIIPPEDNDPPDPNYDGEAAYRTYLRAAAPPIPPGQFQEFCPAEIPVRAALLQGDTRHLKCYQSAGFLLSPIPNSSQPIQIIHSIYETAKCLNLEPDWANLPPNWLVPDQKHFPQATNFTIFIPLREEVLAGADGDSINLFELDPTDVESDSRVVFPRCITLAGLLLPSSTRQAGVSLLVQFMPLHWNPVCRMEALLLRNFPLDDKGSLTRLLLHVIEEYFDSCLRKNGQDELEYYLVLVPSLIDKTKTMEGIVSVYLPPIVPGVNMDLVQRFRHSVGLREAHSVILSLGWTSILMAGNLGDLLKPEHLRQLPEVVPKEMTITGLAPGTQLPEILVALWADTNWSPTCFDRIGAAYIDRSAPFSTTPTSFTKAILATHGQYDTLHLILSSRSDELEATRLFPGRETGTRLGFDVQGQRYTPISSGLAPTDMPSYIPHARAYLKLLPPAPPTPAAGRARPTRAPLRPARGPPRPGRTDNTAPPAAPKLRVIDAEVRARYQLAMWADPLMTEVIPEGASSSAPSTLSPALRTSLSSQSYWTKEPQEQPGPTLTAWTRNLIRSSSLQPCGCSISAPPLVSIMDNVNIRVSTHDSPRLENESAYQSYCARAILARPIRRTWKPLSSPPWQQLYDTYLQRAVPSTSTSTPKSLSRTWAIRQKQAYRKYLGRVQESSTPRSASLPLVSARTLRQDSQNQAYASYLTRAFEFDLFPVLRRRFPRSFLPRPAPVTPPFPRASFSTAQPPPPHARKMRPSKPPHSPACSYEQSRADHTTFALASRLSRHPAPTRADERFFTVGLSFLLGYNLLRCRGSVPEGWAFLSHRSAHFPASYNHWDERPWIRTLQQVLIGVRSFSPPSFTWFRKSPPPPSILQRPMSQLLILHLATLQYDPRSSHSKASPPLARFLAASHFSLPGGLPCGPTGGGHGRRKRDLPPPPHGTSKKTKLLSKQSPRRAATKTQRDATQGSPPRVKLKPIPLSDDSSQPQFSLTPSQSPGPTRTLSELRLDPRIPQDGRQVGIAPTLLPFEGEGLFSFEDIYFPLYDTKGVKTRWRPTELAICSYRGRKVRHSVATRPDYKSAYLCDLIRNEWVLDAQDYDSCYGRFVNDNFTAGTINCKLLPYTSPDTGEAEVWVVALPGVRILPGEELYADYGKDYWLDHLPDLPAASRTMCIQKYKYRHSELTKAGLNPDGSRPTSAPSILPFLRPSHPTLARPSLFLHEETVGNGTRFRLHMPQPPQPYFHYDPHLSLDDKRSLLRTHLRTEPLLQLHLQDSAELYNVCSPDGSCGIQLALLYQMLHPDDWTEDLLSHDPSQPYLTHRPRGPGPTHLPRVLELLQTMIDTSTSPGSHVRASLQAWHQGLSSTPPRSRLLPDQYLEVEEVLQLIPPHLSASVFVELAYDPIDTVHHQVWSILQADTYFPQRLGYFSGDELDQLLSRPLRASVLRGSHYYPFVASSSQLRAWTTAAIEDLIHCYLPTPEEPLSPSSPPDPRPLQLVSAPALMPLPARLPIVPPPSPSLAQCQWWAPLIVQMGDLRLWLAPSTRQRRDIAISLGNVHHLTDLVLSGAVPVSCALKVPRSALHTSACRPDGSCGLQMACLARLLGDVPTPFPTLRTWFFHDPARRTSFRNILSQWESHISLPASTKAKVAGTMRWFDEGAPGLLSPDFWFTNVDIHAVLDQAVNVPLWHRLHSSNWDEWLVLDGCSGDRVLADHVGWQELSHLLLSTHLQSALTDTHFSPWKCSPDISPLLPQALTALIDELTAQPLLEGASGPFTRISSRIQSSHSAEVRILLKSGPSVTASISATSPPDSLSSSAYSIPLSVLLPAASPASNLPKPAGSILSRPGRPLTLADFPSPASSVDPDLQLSPAAGSPYQTRFQPQLFTLPLDESRLPPTGIWPSAQARRWTSTEWHTKLLPAQPSSLLYGFQPLQSTSGPFSVLSAILGSLNYGTDTVLSFWKRAEAYLAYAWERADCYPAQRLSLHTIHTNLDAYRDTRSLSVISGLRLPYTPSLLELFQRCSSPRLQPVLFYVLAGAHSGPLRVIDLLGKTETWYMVANPSSLLKRAPRNPFLTLLDCHSQIHGTTLPLQGPLPDPVPVSSAIVPYHPPVPTAAAPPQDRDAFGSDSLTRFLETTPDAFPLQPSVPPPSPDEFRIAYLNVNGLDGFKFAELLMFMALAAVDCLTLIDVRIPADRIPFFRREARAQLGPHAECLVSVPARTDNSTVPSPIKVGGIAIILNNRWGPQLVNHRSDPSQLGVVDEAVLKLPTGRLQILATYWPFPPPSRPDPQNTDSDAPLRHGLYHRLSHYLRSQRSTSSPLHYAQDTIQHWVQKHMAQPGHHSICGGDFNSVWTNTDEGGGGYKPPLRDWAQGIGLKSRHHDLPSSLKYITRPSPNLTGGSEIDHVLYNSPSMSIRHSAVGTLGLWVGLSDHRPLLVCFNNLPHDHLHSVPRFHKEPGSRRHLHIKRFAPSAPQLQKFKDQLSASWKPLLGRPESSSAAAAQLQHLTDITLEAAPERKCWKRRDRFKHHWSPTYAALQAQLLAMLSLQRHLGVLPCPPRLRSWNSSLDISLGIAQVVGEWERVVSTLKFPHGVPPEVWGTGLSPSEWRTQNPSDLNALRLAAISNFKLVRSQLHARKRKEYAVRSSTYIAAREDNLTAGHMHASFLSLLNELPEGVDLQHYDFGTDETPPTPAALHDYVTNMFLRHFRAQCTPSTGLHDGSILWEDLQHMSYADFRHRHANLHIPSAGDDDPLFTLWTALHHSPARDAVHADLHPLLHAAPSFEKFAALVKSKQGNSSGGPSGLQYKHIQHWKPEMIAEAYECLARMWQDRSIPVSWKWKWLVPIPKSSSKRIQDIRPIMLMEVLRKLWTGLLVDEVTASLQRHSSLSLSQHGYLPHHGTDTANLQLLNTLETAWDARRPLYGCSWDMSKAFDSVSKPLIVLCWQRLGLPAEIAQWLVDLDANGYTIVRTPHALAKWDVEGLEGLKELSFNPERGTGQGDIHSPFTWLAVFDVLLTVLDCQQPSPDQFHLYRPDGSSYPARPICYADDLQSFASTLSGLQHTADLVSVFAMVFNLTIATSKLRAFHYGGLSQPPDDTELLQIHAAGWVPHEVPIRHRGTFKSLGVLYPINPNDSTSLQLMKQKLIITIRALSIKRASPRAINLVMAKCLYARGAYVGVLSSWSLKECEEIDTVFAAEIRRRTKNLKTSQSENLFQPLREGGLGYQRFSSMVQQRKRNCMRRIFSGGDQWTRLAIEGLCARGHSSPHHSPLTAITPQCVRPGFWISSLLSYGMKGNTCPTKPLRASSRATPPQLSDSLVGGFRSNPKWTKAQSAYIRDRHLNTYADIVTWSGNHWTWRLLDLPQPLQELLLPVLLPVEESIPLLPGQA